MRRFALALLASWWLLAAGPGVAHGGAGQARLRPANHKTHRTRVGKRVHRPRKTSKAERRQSRLATRLQAKNKARSLARARVETKTISQRPRKAPSRLLARTKRIAKATWAPMRKATAAIGRVLGPPWRRMGGRIAIAFDGLERTAPHWLRPGIRILRDLGPTHMAAFMVHRVKADPVFLVSYATTSAVVSQAATPFLMAFGVDPVTSFMARYVTIPLDVAVMFFRERQLRRRDNPGLSTGDVARDLLREYRSFAAARRVRGKEALRAHRGQGGSALPIGAH